MDIQSIRTKEEFFAAFKDEFASVNRGMLLECEFSLVLSTDIPVNNKTLLISSLQFPEMGLTWNMDQQLLFYNTPTVSAQPLSLGFIPIIDPTFHDFISPIHQICNEQFIKGLPVLPQNRKKVDASISMVAPFMGPTTLLKLTGCLFTIPVPSINTKSANIAEFKTTITYQSFEKTI